MGDSKDSGKGNLAGIGTKEGEEPTWHESLLGYCGSEAARERQEKQMRELAQQAGVDLDYNVTGQWQPVASQRAMLFCARQGAQEKFMAALGRRHFQQRQSASHTKTLLEAANEAGVCPEELAQFLRTDELEEEVWRSYGDTINKYRIHSIPLFIFNVAGRTSSGPFRDGSKPEFAVHGSGNVAEFRKLFQTLERVAAT